MNTSGLSWIVATLDAPAVLDCTVTSIPASSSSPLQVVTSLIYDASQIQAIDGVGQYVGIYTGAAGVEKLIAVVGGGGTILLSAAIPKGSRVSVRNMVNVPITNGSMTLLFLATPGRPQ